MKLKRLNLRLSEEMKSFVDSKGGAEYIRQLILKDMSTGGTKDIPVLDKGYEVLKATVKAEMNFWHSLGWHTSEAEINAFILRYMENNKSVDPQLVMKAYLELIESGVVPRKATPIQRETSYFSPRQLLE